jgi:hypothetical protein
VIAYGNSEDLEYDLRLAPGSDATDVRLRVSGADGKRIDSAGDLVMTTGGHEARMKMTLWTAAPARVLNSRARLAQTEVLTILLAVRRK